MSSSSAMTHQEMSGEPVAVDSGTRNTPGQLPTLLNQAWPDQVGKPTSTLNQAATLNRTYWPLLEPDPDLESLQKSLRNCYCFFCIRVLESKIYG
jgi:hypothetical protein